MAHRTEVEQPGEDALQFRPGCFVDQGESRRGHQVVAGSLAAHLPIEPQRAETGLAAAHARQHQHDALVTSPRLLLARMKVETGTWLALLMVNQSYQGRASPGRRGLH